MSDELAAVMPVVQVLGGMLLMKGVDFFWGKFLSRGDDLEKKLEAAKEAAIVSLQSKVETLEKTLPLLATKERVDEKVEAIEKTLPLLATKERVDGLSAVHAENLHQHDRWLTKIDTRQRDALGIADSDEVRTNPGYKPSPAIAALQAKHRSKDGE